jgi:hypothetical protein
VTITLCLASDCSREYAAIIFVRKGQLGNQILIAHDESIESRSIHQLACAFQFLPREIRPILEEVGNPLLMNGIGPLGAENASQRQMHQKITQFRWI